MLDFTLQVLKEFFQKCEEKYPPVSVSVNWAVQLLSYSGSSVDPWQDKHNKQNRGVSWSTEQSSGNN